jgi:hypothetical protein
MWGIEPHFEDFSLFLPLKDTAKSGFLGRNRQNYFALVGA